MMAGVVTLNGLPCESSPPIRAANRSFQSRGASLVVANCKAALTAAKVTNSPMILARFGSILGTAVELGCGFFSRRGIEVLVDDLERFQHLPDLASQRLVGQPNVAGEPGKAAEGQLDAVFEV